MPDLKVVQEQELMTPAHADYWAQRVRAEYAKSVEANLKIGQQLIEAKGALKHGEWGRLTGQTQPGGKGLLPFGADLAQRYMAIARDLRLSNTDHVRHLPTAVSTLHELSKLDDETFEQALAQGKINPEMERKDVAALTAYTHVSDDSYEWYTPPEYIQSARAVMGGIDLDPATSDKANEIVKAEMIYTLKDNGLKQNWHGNVWLNPPYCMPEVGHFTRKCVDSFLRKEIGQAIILVNNATDTGWFGYLLETGHVCFTDGRVHFYGEDGEQKLQTRQGQAFFYLGNRAKTFMQAFKKYGFVGKLDR